MIAATFVPDEALLHEVAEAALKAGMHIISNGHRTVVSPIIPPGFTKIIIRTRPINPASEVRQ